jgi:farnesyl diphosphate synthase
MRRGKPTTHRAFDEAMAILAGDALLTLSFDMIADDTVHRDGSIRAKLVQLYARAAGLGGMVGGQALDLAAEGKTLDESAIATLQAMKTGALIGCACEAGAIIGDADPDERNALKGFGLAIGQAFQLADDILDVTSSPEAMGKQTAKDDSRGKGTLVDLHGVDATRIRAQELLAQATGRLQSFGKRAEPLASAAEFMVNRDH